MHAPIIGLSLVGRREYLANPTALKKWGLASLRLSVQVPLQAEDIRQMESARDAGCFILAVLQFSPEDPLWPAALPAVIRRFQSCVTHWEIGSEPDDPAFGWPADQLTRYAACLIQAAAMIKDIDPQAQIHNGGLGRSLPKGIAQLCALGAGLSVDVWNVHPYMNPLMPDAKGAFQYFQDIIRQTRTQQGQALKPVWWSSIACPGMQDPSSAKAWWLGKNPTETMQAEWLKIIYAAAAKAKVERIFWEGWQDQPHQPPTGIDSFGFLRSDGSPKPITEVLSAACLNGL